MEQDGREERRIQFERYVLDKDRGCLLVDANEITLRPKTYGVLQYFVHNANRLVSKEDLFAAVWPDVAVTDDVLVQSIVELRRALGTDGPRLIKTIPRRGYRFEASVSSAPQINNLERRADNGDASIGSVDILRDGRTAKYTNGLGRVLQLASSKLPAIPAGDLRKHGALTGLAVILALALVLGGATLWRGIGTWHKSSSHRLTENTSVDAKPSVAVLPFANHNEDRARQYFVDGVTQDIINRLGRFSGLTVMSWNAISGYRDKPAKPPEIANALGVRYQVEGAVRQVGERIEVIMQLVDPQGRVLWSGRFDEAMVDLFALQEKITTLIAGALAVRVTDAEHRRVLAVPSGNLVAYDYLLRARPALQRPTRAGIVEARELLKRAIEIDPGYAAAIAALADTYHTDVAWGWAESPGAALGKAEALAVQALRFDQNDQLAHNTLGRIHLFYNRFGLAKTEVEQAIAINPSNAQALADRGNVLVWLGEVDAAIESLELAQRIDPELNAIDRFSLSLAYYLKKRYDAAIEQAEHNLTDPGASTFSYAVLIAALAQQGRTADAAGALTKLRRLNPSFDPEVFGSKFMKPADLAQLRDGLAKAGLFSPVSSAK